MRVVDSVPDGVAPLAAGRYRLEGLNEQNEQQARAAIASYPEAGLEDAVYDEVRKNAALFRKLVSSGEPELAVRLGAASAIPGGAGLELEWTAYLTSQIPGLDSTPRAPHPDLVVEPVTQEELRAAQAAGLTLPASVRPKR